MRILLTGFEPFGGSSVNPSEEVCRAISELDFRSAGLDVRTRVLPVDANRAPAMLRAAVTKTRPHAVLCLGESAQARYVTIERVFVNLADYPLADNAGVVLKDRPIARGGPAAYFTTLPVQTLITVMRNAEVDVDVSLSAGTFLCNHVAYVLRHDLERRRARAKSPHVIPAGFVHLPRLPEQVQGERRQPSLPLETMIRGVIAMMGGLAARHSW